MLNPTAGYLPPTLDYLPSSFSPESVRLIEELAALAIQHVLNDTESTVTPENLHQVARTLLSAECDARTVMIFFLSLLDDEERQRFATRLEPDLLEAAHNVSIIRLISPSDAPKHLPIRKILLRQLVLKVTHDVRVILIKIAGRLVTMRNAEKWQPHLRQALAKEALDVVVPWCDALGVDQWRQELQELSFRYLNPEQYNHILSLVADQRDTLHAVKDQVIRELNELARRLNIEASISGRVKTHYAIYRKMQAYELSYDDVWDRIGIRILTRTVFDCYYIQMAIEEYLYPDRRRYVDYIEKPRQPYHYQSIHLTVCGPDDTLVEIQIRTYDMHVKGEYGVAAHWKMYGGGDGVLSIEDTKFAFLRTQASKLLGDPMVYLGNTLDELLQNNSILPTDTSGYLLDPNSGERLKNSRFEDIHYRDVVTNHQGYVLDPYTSELILSVTGEPIWYQGEVLPDRVIVYTRDGDLKSLPNGATPLDFAYYVHEAVGHSCIGARVNGKMQKLDHTLHMGDRVEVITRQGAKPSLDWLYNGFVRTKRAQDKIKRFFREKTDIVLPEVKDLGQTIINKRLSAHRIRDLSVDYLAEMMGLKTAGDLLEALGMGEISITKLDEVLGAYVLKQLSQSEAPPIAQTIHHESDFMYKQAQCCLPVPGDETVSYITQGRGFTLHRTDCRNIATLDPERLAPFVWNEERENHDPRHQHFYQSRLLVLVAQPTRTILHIKEIASMEGLNLDNIKAHESKQLGHALEITLRVRGKSQLEKFMRKLNASDDILMVRRATG